MVPVLAVPHPIAHNIARIAGHIGKEDLTRRAAGA